MADMSRRRPSAGNQSEGVSKKRKYDEVSGGNDSADDSSSNDFPCHYCSSVFVTQMSLSRHLLSFHNGNGAVREELKEEYVEENDENSDGNEYEDKDESVKQEYYEDNEDEIDGEYEENEEQVNGGYADNEGQINGDYEENDEQANGEYEDNEEQSNGEYEDNDEQANEEYEENEEQANGQYEDNDDQTNGEYEDNDEATEGNAQINYNASANGYFENDEDGYYYDTEDNVDLSGFLETSTNMSMTEYQEGTPDADELIGSQTRSSSSSPQKNGGGKPKLSPQELSKVLEQVEQITNATVSEFVTCPLCRKTFGRKELPIHIKCEHGGSKFTCPYCNRAISRRDHLKRHIKNVHPDKCTETEIGPFPRNLNLSRATNSQQKKGDGPAINEMQQQEHRLNMLPISIVPPLSQFAEADDEEDDDFEGEDLLQAHNLSMKDKDNEQDESMQITVEPDLPFQDLNDYGDDDYQSPNFLLDDLLNPKGKSAYANGNSVTLDNMAYQCSLCNAVFSSKILLDRHEATHSELRPHKCGVCGKGFLRKEHLSKHLSSVHSGMKFTCEFCGKDISRKDHLIRHIRNVHPNQFYALPQDAAHELLAGSSQQSQVLTNAAFQAAVQIKAAQSLQPKKKPFFNCDMCEATFVNVDDLHAHQSTIHSDVRKYKCNYCCKAFKRKEHLTKHEVLHTGERNHTCRICGNEFLRKDALQDHIRRTHGIDPRNTPIVPKAVPTLPCNLCDQLFQDRGMLLSHMTTVHGLIVNSPPGLPKNIQQQRAAVGSQSQPRQSNSQKNGGAKPPMSINGSNLGSLMDLINKGSITLSFHPMKSE